MPQLALCIPARNEAGELPGLFAALERLDPGPWDAIDTCLLLDACTDASERLAIGYRRASRHRVHIAHAAAPIANAGRARRQAFDLGLSFTAGAGDLLLTTDADSRPATDWIAAMTTALGRADIVTGRIERDGGGPSPAQDRLEAYYDALFALRRRLDPVPWEADRTHHFTGGANLGCRADVYRALGGFAPIASGEDARLVDDAGRAGYRVRRDAACLVHTSDRRHGRAPQGLAAALRQLDHGDVTGIAVTHPDDAAWQYRLQAQARHDFDRGRFDLLAVALGLGTDHVRGVARDCPNAEAFAMRVVPAAPGGMRQVGLAVAEVALDRLVARRQAA